ncbi:MAG: glucan biosynthesis protein D, partial [Hyphomicrobiales bacterium]
MVARREVLKFVLGGMAGGIAARAGVAAPANVAPPSAAQEAPGGFALGEPSPFDPKMVTDAAKILSKQPFKPLSAGIPDVFRDLGYEQYAAIRPRPGTAIWAADNTGFAIEPLHRGFIFSTPMEINLVAEGKARRVIYDPALFDFGKLAVPKNLGDIGFSGFRVLAQGQDNFSEL